MRTAVKIQAEIDAKTRELEAALAEEAKMAAMPEDEQLAVVLHDFLCHWNHTDGCSWGYESDWKGWAHKRYLEKAREVLKKPEMNLETISAVIEAIK